MMTTNHQILSQSIQYTNERAMTTKAKPGNNFFYNFVQEKNAKATIPVNLTLRIKIPVSTDQVFIDRLNDLIMNNIEDSQFNVAQLASLMQMSKRSLHYKIKSLLGFTPSKYINEIRLLIAEQQLRNKSYMIIAEVCYSVGFQKPTYFSQLFKKRFGKVPSAYLHF